MSDKDLRLEAMRQALAHCARYGETATDDLIEVARAIYDFIVGK